MLWHVRGIDSAEGIKLESSRPKGRQLQRTPENSSHAGRDHFNLLSVSQHTACSGLFCCGVPTRTGLAVWLSNRALWIPEITLPKVYISQDIVTSALPSSDEQSPGASIAPTSAVNIWQGNLNLWDFVGLNVLRFRISVFWLWHRVFW
jgi:hypothetical protein